ncbi:MAG: hypothetical protein LAD29_02235 [Rhodoferax sp.]|jgi:hypothetical protein|nr:hypothetical protein [Rhodoferax sp.]
MFGFFGLGRRRRARQHETQREMVRVALNSVLRRRGMATSSIGCELLSLSRPGASEVMLVQLLIRAWEERLIHEAVDLEAELFDVICLYSRSAATTDFLVSWKFAIDRADASKSSESKSAAAKPEPKSAEPSLAMPPKLAAVPSTVPAFKFDLPKTDLDLDDDQRHHEYGFPATVIRSP